MNNIPLEIRIFGSKNCGKCNKLIEEMNRFSFDYIYIDADLDKNQEICDHNMVDEMPHIQAYDAGNGAIIYQHIGYIHPTYFLDRVVEKIKEILKEKENEPNSSI